MRLSIFVSSLVLCLLLFLSVPVQSTSQNHTTVSRDVSNRLKKYNRAAQAAVSIDSKDAAKAFTLFALPSARLTVPRTGLMTFDFPVAVTRILPVFKYTQWLPLFDHRVAYLNEVRVAALADVMSRFKDGCATGEPVVARMRLDASAYVTELEMSSEFASAKHRDAARCGDVTSEPEDTATLTAALLAKHNAAMQKLTSLNDFAGWLQAILSEHASVYMAGQSAVVVGRDHAAATAFPVPLQAVLSSVRRSYVLSRDTIIADVMLQWRPKHCDAFATHALVSLKYEEDGTVSELEVYVYDYTRYATYIERCIAAAASAVEDASEHDVPEHMRHVEPAEDAAGPGGEDEAAGEVEATTEASDDDEGHQSNSDQHAEGHSEL